MRHAVNLQNHAPFKHEMLSQIEKFTLLTTQPNFKPFHIFGFPVFVLQNNLQAQKRINTWLPGSQLGIYWGQSDQHARSVSSVLSLTTGLASAQFHIENNDFFETILWDFTSTVSTYSGNLCTNTVSPLNLEQSCETGLTRVFWKEQVLVRFYESRTVSTIWLWDSNCYLSYFYIRVLKSFSVSSHFSTNLHHYN